MFASVESVYSHLLDQKDEAFKQSDASTDPANTFFYLGRASGIAYALRCFAECFDSMPADFIRRLESEGNSNVV